VTQDVLVTHDIFVAQNILVAQNANDCVPRRETRVDDDISTTTSQKGKERIKEKRKRRVGFRVRKQGKLSTIGNEKSHKHGRGRATPPTAGFVE
jgi:hypothetical protein